MSKDLVITFIVIAVASIIWAVSSFLHAGKTSKLPVGINSYLQEVNPEIDFQLINKLKLDQ